MSKLLIFFNFFEFLIPRSVILYNLLKSETKDETGFFHLDVNEYSNNMSCSPRQLQRCLKELSEYKLIERNYRALKTGSRLFIKVNEPTINNHMVFSAEYEECETIETKQLGNVKRVRVKNIFNHNRTINLERYWIDFNKNNKNFLESLNSGDHLLFDAEVVMQEGKFHELREPKNLRNKRIIMTERVVNGVLKNSSNIKNMLSRSITRIENINTKINNPIISEVIRDLYTVQEMLRELEESLSERQDIFNFVGQK